MFKLYKLNNHIRDERIRFDEEPHIYYIDGKSYDESVTKFIHSLFPCFDADKVINNMKRSKKWNTSPYYGMTDDEIKNQWENNRIISSESGTKLHKDIELFYNDIDINNDSIEFKYFLKFNNDFNYLSPYRTEWEIFDEDYKLAGSIDMVYFNNTNNTYEIYDWKRSKEIKKFNQFENGFGDLNHLPNCNFWHYSLQLNIYKRILETKYNINISKLCLVVLHPLNTSYQRIECPNLDNEVNKILEKRLNMIN